MKTIIVKHKDNQHKYKNYKVIRFNNNNDILVFNITRNKIYLTINNNKYSILEFDKDLSQEVTDDSYNYISTNINKFLNSKIYNTLYIKYLKENNIDELVVGYNKEWKQDIKLSKRNNQNFVNIPFDNYIKMIEYKCLLEGIKFKTREESYTSKCSSIDLEPICKQNVYLGSRTKRGLYITMNGLRLNGRC